MGVRGTSTGGEVEKDVVLDPSWTLPLLRASGGRGGDGDHGENLDAERL